jgi:polysaccharide pyruvyl transferase WcaK-like protein
MINAPYRILVDSGDYSCGNLGDVAMLMVALRRLRNVFPDARLDVLTDDPGLLSAHCPEARPVPRKGRDQWFGAEEGPGGLQWLLPRVSSQISRMKEGLRRQRPGVWETIVCVKMRLRGSSGSNVRAFLDSLLNADLCVVAGAGGITDHAHAWSRQVLNLLELAAQWHTPAAVMSHGLGPLRNGQLRERAGAVLSSTSLVALREKRAGLALLQSMGVSKPCVLVTGDDAIELAYEARPGTPGTAVGINLRVARSADVGREFIPRLRQAGLAFARAHGTRLLPVPIGHGRASQDTATLREVLAGVDEASDGGVSLDTPLKVIRQVGCCRIVVTGAYHAAVFALSQGIPAICVARSPYFVDKFLGLADQFGRGCEIVFLDAEDFPRRLKVAMEAAWAAADQLRPGLLAAAVGQITASQDAYARLGEVVRDARVRRSLGAPWSPQEGAATPDERVRGAGSDLAGEKVG